MTGDPTIQAELRQLDTLMHRLAEAKGVPLAKVIRNASKDFAFEAQRATPVAKITKSPYWFIKAPKSGQPRWVVKWSAKSKSGWQKQLFRKVSKGYAKASWLGMMSALGIGKGAGKFQSAQRTSTAIAQAADSERNPVVRMLASLSYINKLDARANIAARGIQRAEAKIINGLAQVQAQMFRRAGGLTID